MRVLHFELTRNYGGIESLLLKISNYILRKNENMQFDFVTTDTEELPYEEELTNLGCNIYRLPAEKNIVNYVRKIDKIMKANKYDVVHIHKNSLINVIPVFVAKYNNISKVIVHSHNTAPTKGNVVLNGIHYINKAILNHINISRVACSKEAGEWLFGNKKKVNVIPNGIELEKYVYDENIRNRVRKEFSILKEEILIGNVGRLEEQKNQLFLIKVLKKLDSKYKLIIIGEGKLRENLVREIKANALSNRVILTGARKDVEDLLQAMDIFAMPSLHEGLPIAGIEAQASGLPVIISDRVSKEVKLTPNVYFEKLQLENWINCIKKINKDRSRNASSYIKEEGYDIESTVNEIFKLYK